MFGLEWVAGAVRRVSGLLEDWPVLGTQPVLVQGGGVVFCVRRARVGSCAFSEPSVCPPSQGVHSEGGPGSVLGRAGGTMTVTQEGAVLVGSGGHNKVPLAGG